MTTAHEVTLSAIAEPGTVSIAGVLWPMYKVVALVIGFAVLVIVGVATMSAAPAVLSAAGAAVAVWLGASIFQPER